MASHLIIGQILAEYHTGYKKGLFDIYIFEIILTDDEPEIPFAKEMFQAFDSLFYVRFENTVFVRGVFNYVIHIQRRNKIDEIKSLLDVVDVIGRDISLSCNGNGEYVGSVPPVGRTGRSLKVDQKLQLWNDTKNGKGGDVLDWIGRDFNDPRGYDFTKVLRIAADLVGVELAKLTEKELEAEKEKVEIHNLFSETVEIYHKNLTQRPELYDYIMENWSITPETVDVLKIGYATRAEI